MTTVEQLGDELAVHPDDIRVLVEQMVDLHYDELPDVVADALRDTLSPMGERSGPVVDEVRDLAEQYRETQDPALLDQLRMHGYSKIVHDLTLERVLAPADAERHSVQIDAWLDGGPEPHVLTWDR